MPDDESDPVGWLHTLATPKPAILRLLQPVLLWLLIGAGVFFGVAGVILLGYTLFAPLYALPAMTYSEALGATLLLSLLVLVVWLLKEGKD